MTITGNVMMKPAGWAFVQIVDILTIQRELNAALIQSASSIQRSPANGNAFTMTVQ
jgi:hypothetical protein